MEWTMMTEQQKRLAVLADSRAWGPFTHEEERFLNSEQKRRRTRPADVQAPDFAPYIRQVSQEEWDFIQLNGYCKTKAMPGE